MLQPVTDQAAFGGQRFPMSYEAWLTWDAAGAKSEWVDGEVIVFMPTTLDHGDLVSFLSTLLTAYVRFVDLGRVVTDSVEMHLASRSRVPDIFYVSTDRIAHLSRTRLDGPADLVAEIVSADSVERDYAEKLAEYAAAGVPEYWVIDGRGAARPRRPEFYHLVDGVYRPIPLAADGRLWSTVVEGFWLRPEWLTQEPLPDALDCLFEIAPAILAAKRWRATAGNDDLSAAIETR